MFLASSAALSTAPPHLPSTGLPSSSHNLQSWKWRISSTSSIPSRPITPQTTGTGFCILFSSLALSTTGHSLRETALSRFG